MSMRSAGVDGDHTSLPDDEPGVADAAEVVFVG